ncbi:unnamed protein product [Auanema sp. JU1783]|nr:unnamed protein product [Auanema sp. JU1783]
MPKQDFEPLDYFGVVAVAVIFGIITFILSFFIINFFCITKYDDITHFEKFGAKRNIRLGPHDIRTIKVRGGLIHEMEENE